MKKTKILIFIPTFRKINFKILKKIFKIFLFIYCVIKL
jgi:hypothetical protein